MFLRGSYSFKGSVKLGIPQASVLGPILFSIFITDLPFHAMNMFVACDMLPDETALYISGTEAGRNTLHESLDKVSCRCDNNTININPKKTYSIIITTRRKH